MTTKTFNAEQFTPTQWDTAEQKARFANQFVRLIERGFQQSDFPQWFYQRLSNCFGHIAHYDRGGFWGSWFSTMEQQADFIQHTARQGGYGDPIFTYSDVERTIWDWIEKHPEHLADLQAKIRNAHETAERSMLARLSAKYSLPVAA